MEGLIILILIYIFISYKLYNYHKKNYVAKNKYYVKQLHKYNNDELQYRQQLKSHVLKNNNIQKREVQQEPPEIMHLHALVQNFEMEQSWDNLIAVGDIYRKGAYPRFKCNKEMATECYKIAAMCPDGKIAGIAQIKYIEINNEHILNIDNKGADLPEYYGIQICNYAKELIANTPYNLFNRPKNNLIRTDPEQPTPITFNNLTGNIGVNTVAIFTRPTRNLNHAVYKNDMQNVHDHGVSQITRKNLDYLKTSYTDKNDNTKEDVIDHILSHPQLSSKIKGNSLLVLDNLTNKERHSTFNVTEKEALDLVWNKLNKETDKDKKNNLIEILAKQLDSSVENGHIVCSSGKISRIIGTLDGIDENITTSKPIWAIKDEIATLAGKIMNGHHNNPKETFQNEVNKIYINELKLEPNIINPIIEEYIEHL
jgi:arsenate reductase-like glutaredoxin family protein